MMAQRKPRILLVMLEFASWERALAQAYTIGFGVEEGLVALGAEVVVLPVFADIEPGDPGSWERHASVALAHQQFDQVWLWLPHNTFSPEFLRWIEKLAPVRVGFVVESLRYTLEDYRQFPYLRGRDTKVAGYASCLTHLAVMDENDVELGEELGLASSFWPTAVPRRSIAMNPPPPVDPSACFNGAVYGARAALLANPLVQGLLKQAQRVGEETGLPKLFEELQSAVLEELRSGQSVGPGLLKLHVDSLRTVRRALFDRYLERVQYFGPVVNLPTLVKTYTNRIAEGMAAGRPVVAWEVPDRPHNRALFQDGKEILLYQDAEGLARCLRALKESPALREQIASAARENLTLKHTMEHRLADFNQWIAGGKKTPMGSRGVIKVGEAPPSTSPVAPNPLASMPGQGRIRVNVRSVRPSSPELCIRRILPSRYLEAADRGLGGFQAANALVDVCEGFRYFPGRIDLLRAASRLAEVANDQAGMDWAAARLKGVGTESPGPPPGFFEQRVPVARIPDRMDLIRRLCTGKKVLHVGCTDSPIFDPANNLHRQLSEFCSQLDGLDVDELGIDELRRLVPGRYYTRAEDVLERYDVLLVPETIEHVDDIAEFLASLAGVEFDLCLITAPNAFLPNDNGNHFGPEGTYVEHVHPDHKAWFSPATLGRCISSFTPWKLKQTYLLGNDSVVACLCERRPRWELQRIPKKIHFYWGNDRTSFLRYLSVWSFRRFNPDWEINLYVPTQRYRGGIPWATGEGYDGAQFKGRDYSNELFSVPGLRIHEVDFAAFPRIAEAPENYKSDFFRWHILSSEGGVYSDIDLLFLKPMADLHLNRRQDKDAEAVVCLQKFGNIIGFLMASSGCAIFRQLFDRSIQAFNTQSYQAISAPMVNEVFPSIDAMREALPGGKVLNLPMSVVYPIDHLSIPDIFLSTDMSRISPETIGIHWYAGHPVAQQFNAAVTSDNFDRLDGVLFQVIGAVCEKAGSKSTVSGSEP